MTPFWEDKERIQRLAGIREDDDDTHFLNAQSARQDKLVAEIKATFDKLGLPLAESNAINYFEDEGYIAIVILDVPVNEGISIKKLAQLYSSGLSAEFTVDIAKGQGLQIQFVVSENKRDAV